MKRTLGDVLHVVLVLVAFDVVGELDTLFQTSVQKVHFVQNQDKLHRYKQLARADRLPRCERVQLCTPCCRLTASSWKLGDSRGD